MAMANCINPKLIFPNLKVYEFVKNIKFKVASQRFSQSLPQEFLAIPCLRYGIPRVRGA